MLITRHCYIFFNCINYNIIISIVYLFELKITCYQSINKYNQNNNNNLYY